MDKIFLIFKREFLTRIRKRSFLLTTILLPLFIFAIYLGIFYFMMYSGTQNTIAVVDNTQIFNDTIKGNKDAEFVFIKDVSQQQLAKQLQEKKYDAFLVTTDSLAATTPLTLISNKSFGMMVKSNVQSAINDRIRELRISKMSLVQQEAIEAGQAKRKINFSTLSGEKESDVKSGVSYAIGMICGYLIFFILIFYGAAVMRGVMEEKINRVAEVIISSVKPFQLMLGKIFGIGAVSMVQFLIWIIIGLILQGLASAFVMQDLISGVAGSPDKADIANFSEIILQIKDVNFMLIGILFLLYFIGGYLLYASLYAMVGCAVSDSEDDAQKLTLPLALPLIFGFVLLSKAINDPNGSIAVFGSLFPLTSPIVMMGRVAIGVPEGVPYWQLILSIIILIISFILSTKLAAKIYRTGILMYGKKPTWKEIFKWAWRKD